MRIDRMCPDRNPRYAEYLNSSAWEAKRKAVKKRCNSICERCHKYLVDDIHHLTYERIYDEPLEDLQGLCRPCHAFLHEESGIDPLAESIHVKVSWRIIEYWDSAAKKFRRVSKATLAKPKTNDGTNLIGKYRVPMHVFLDRQGNPVFDPSRWQQYRTASRHGRGWMGYGNSGIGRSIPPDPAEQRTKVEQQETRMGDEEQRLREAPSSFTSYKGQIPATDKEVIALFKKYPRIVDAGRDGMIINATRLKTQGLSLTVQFDEAGGGWMRCKVCDADKKLNAGEIVLDHERETWVVTKQPHYPQWILDKLGIERPSANCPSP